LNYHTLGLILIVLFVGDLATSKEFGMAFCRNWGTFGMSSITRYFP
jgi:hypothetical protein